MEWETWMFTEWFKNSIHMVTPHGRVGLFEKASSLSRTKSSSRSFSSSTHRSIKAKLSEREYTVWGDTREQHRIDSTLVQQCMAACNNHDKKMKITVVMRWWSLTCMPEDSSCKALWHQFSRSHKGSPSRFPLVLIKSATHAQEAAEKRRGVSVLRLLVP